MPDGRVAGIAEGFAAPELRLAKLIDAATVARVLTGPGDRWDTRRARRWLKRSGAGFRLSGDSGKWVTTLGRLRDRFGDIADLVLIETCDD